MYVYNKLRQDDPFFYPGAPSNEIPFYNRLIHYGKKRTKEKKGKNYACKQFLNDDFLVYYD